MRGQTLITVQMWPLSKKYKIILLLVFLAVLWFIDFYQNHQKTNIQQYHTYITKKRVVDLTAKLNQRESAAEQNKENITVKQDEPIKYILQWTSSKWIPLINMSVGQKVFVDTKCPYTNCFVTDNKTFLSDYTKFDVIAFHGPELKRYRQYQLPKRRSLFQKYVFVSIESEHYYPICAEQYNGFFNWTWTYKLDSDVRWEYIVVRDIHENIIGPNKDMHWIRHRDMKPVSEQLKEVLRRKTKLAAWFVSNCHAKSRREKYVNDLNKVLLRKYKLTVDVYGYCGRLNCSRDVEKECDELIRQNYYFYLAFENSFSEDYVTEKILHAIEYNAVPIVYGGANYSRFLPDGSYLNAKELTATKLATKMYELYTNFDQYVEYFRWTNHYRYHRKQASQDSNTFCRMCEILNDDSKVKQVSLYENFTSWWNNGSCFKKPVFKENRLQGFTYKYKLKPKSWK